MALDWQCSVNNYDTKDREIGKTMCELSAQTKRQWKKNSEKQNYKSFNNSILAEHKYWAPAIILSVGGLALQQTLIRTFLSFVVYQNVCFEWTLSQINLLSIDQKIPSSLFNFPTANWIVFEIYVNKNVENNRPLKLRKNGFLLEIYSPFFIFQYIILLFYS